jgi:transcriptional regulator with XRE-family HTH domain
MKTEAERELCRQFGKRLAEIRKAKGWSQEKLALESGIARSYLGDVERGMRNIALVNICKIADTLELDLSILMDFRKCPSS